MTSPLNQEQDGKSTPPLPASAKLTVAAQFNAEARGSQTALLAFVIGAFAVIICGAILACSTAPGAAPIAWFLVIVGTLVLLPLAAYMWIRSQRLTDRGLLPVKAANSIMVKSSDHGTSSELVISGTHPQETIRELALAIASRRTHRVPLPPAAGKVIGSASDAHALSPFSEAEAEADQAELKKTVEKSEIIEAKMFAAISAPAGESVSQQRMENSTLSAEELTDGKGDVN